jgi:hypothetical protein
VKYIFERLQEPSTWRGLALFLGAVGVHLQPELVPAIGTAVTAAIGAVEVIRKEIK